MPVLIVLLLIVVLSSSSLADRGEAGEETRPFVAHELCGDLRPAGPDLLYRQHDLYGRIDGGAELFLEFGFEELTVRRLEGADGVVEVETYRMRDPAAALGIYLAKCGREEPVAEIPARHTANRYQILMVQGRDYVQFNNIDGEEDLAGCLRALARETTARVRPDPPLAIWERLPAAGRVAGTEKLLRGPFALQPIYELGPGDILRLGGRILAAAARYEAPDGGTFTLIVVPYPDAETADAAYEHLLGNLDPYLDVVDRGPRGFAFRDWQDEYGLVVVREDVLEIKVHLAGRPALP
jgi:hypothetical protein